ncbi:MAG: Cold shock-like protein CspC [Chlamydiae bacterium]|nr:Cold shock-like protein CspC [Chlamydiota bacterium]
MQFLCQNAWGPWYSLKMYRWEFFYFLKQREIQVAKSKGIVKFFNSQKGFGFITPESGGKELFVHVNSLAGGTQTLSEGQQVEYVEEEGRKGPEAKEVEGL